VAALASVALVVAVVALVVSLTRESSNGTTTPSSSVPSASIVSSVTVPDVVGKQATEGLNSVAATGLVAIVTNVASATVPARVIQSQTPRAGTTVARGSTVTLVVSVGPA